MSSVELGCGLIAIGRPWGITPEVPSESAALEFLDSAYEAGIRSFDTAPSYGLSEQRLGKFLGSLTATERLSVTVSTKFGEHWDSERQEAYTDHSEAALKKSIDQSADRLGDIDLIQLHKSSVEVLDSDAYAEASDYAFLLGIRSHGVSVSDVPTAEYALLDHGLDTLQLPYNQAQTDFQPIIETARLADWLLYTNRPFQMGQTLETAGASKHDVAVAAFTFILQASFNGVVLSGTANPDHLLENITAFTEAQQLESAD